MTSPAPLTYYDPFDPAEWGMRHFALGNAGGILAALPPGVGIENALGTPDPYDYDRPPGSDKWFPIGDGVPKERPLLQLSGRHVYRTADEAMEHAAQLETAVRTATALYWQGQYLCDLSSGLPQVIQTKTGSIFQDTTYTVTLNTSIRVTRKTLVDAVNLWRIVESGAGYAVVEPRGGRSFVITPDVLLTTLNGATFNLHTAGIGDIP